MKYRMKPLVRRVFENGLFLFLLAGAAYWVSLPVPSEPLPDDDDAVRPIYDPVLAAFQDDSVRDFWQKPGEVLASLGELDGKRVADIGAGEGYFTLRLLDLVGESGHVYATDIQKVVLDTLRTRIPEDRRQRASLILSSETELGIPDKVDVVLLVQVIGEVPDKVGFLKQLRDIMHEDSRLVIIDSKHVTDSNTGYTRPRNLATLKRKIEEAGLALDPEFEGDEETFLPKQFFFVVRRQA